METNLIYFKDKIGSGNFGDELSKFITVKLINEDKYKLVYNKKNIERNIVCIGSYLHMAPNDSYVFGSGIRIPDDRKHKFTNLKVCAVRGPLTKKYLENKKIKVPSVFGDPALLLPKYYTPNKIDSLKNKIGIVPHKSNYIKYVDKIDSSKYHLICPTNKWEDVIDSIYSCEAILSSSLHGLICADAYNIPNLWLDEYPLGEGDFKFRDYFDSQKRKYVKIKKIDDYKDSLLYTNGNQINLEQLINSFPFR